MLRRSLWYGTPRWWIAARSPFTTRTPQKGQQQVSPQYTGQWTSPAITSDTVFTVSVTVITTGGAPLTAAMSVSVAVRNPDLVAKSLTAGAIIAQGRIEGWWRLALSDDTYRWNDGQHIHSLGGQGNGKAVGSDTFSIMPPYFGLLKVLRIK
jgi:hypothetical protein